MWGLPRGPIAGEQGRACGSDATAPAFLLHTATSIATRGMPVLCCSARRKHEQELHLEKKEKENEEFESETD